MANYNQIYSKNAEFSYFSISDNNENHAQRGNLIQPDLKMQGIVKENKNNTNFYCEICQLKCDTLMIYNSHINGAKHNKNKVAYNILMEHPEYLSKVTGDFIHSSILTHFLCETCAVTIDGIISFHSHCHSQKHLKALEKIEKSRNMNKNIQMSKNGNKNDLLKPNENTTPINPHNLEQIVDDEKINWLRCLTCESSFSKNLLQSHLNGFKHKTITQDKLDYIEKGGVAADFKPDNKKLRKRKAATTDKFWKLQLTDNKKENSELQATIKTFSKFDDRHLNVKYQSIAIGHIKNKRLTAFIEKCENALKIVSDEMLNEDLEGFIDAPNDAELREERRILKSVMRVGPFFQSTMLSGENTAECIILVSVLPTAELLFRISQHLANKIKEIFGEIEVLVHMGDGEILVSLVNGDENGNLECIFHVTSSLFNELEQEKLVENNDNVLNKDKGIQLLRILRRCKWFQVCLRPCKHINVILTILRDISARDEVWGKLDPWVIELLLEKVYSVINMNHGISAVFRFFFEFISSGLIINDDIILLDPCEKDETSVLANLTFQHKEDLTKSAQYYLRLISMKRINEVLNMDKIKFPIFHKRFNKRSWPKKQRLDEIKLEKLES